MADYSENPVLQRALARRMSTAPNVRAVITTGDLEAAAAKEQQARDMEGERVGTAINFGEQRLAQQATEYNNRMALARERLAMSRKDTADSQRQGQIASYISGAGAIMSGVKGYRDVQAAKASKAKMDEISQGYLDLARKTAEGNDLLSRILAEAKNTDNAQSVELFGTVMGPLFREVLGGSPGDFVGDVYGANTTGSDNSTGSGNTTGSGNEKPKPKPKPRWPSTGGYE